MPAVVNASIMLFAAWCFIEAALCAWIIKTWDEPYQSHELNEAHLVIPMRAHRSMKLMHARRGAGWLTAGGLAAWYAYSNM